MSIPVLVRDAPVLRSPVTTRPLFDASETACLPLNVMLP